MGMTLTRANAETAEKLRAVAEGRDPNFSDEHLALFGFDPSEGQGEFTHTSEFTNSSDHADDSFFVDGVTPAEFIGVDESDVVELDDNGNPPAVEVAVVEDSAGTTEDI